MKKFLRINKKDKEFVKMINQSPKGFELVILEPKILDEIMKTISLCKEKGDSIDMVWQMKFKSNNFILYKDCEFFEPVDNYFKQPVRKWGFYKLDDEPAKLCGKKIKVKCSGVSYYSHLNEFKNRLVHLTYRSTKLSDAEMRAKYKDAKLLDRMLKIGELNYKSIENV